MKKRVKYCLAGIGLIIAAGILTAVIMIFMADRYQGAWKMQGYGFSFRVSNGLVRTYSVTENHYVRMSDYDGIIIKDTLYCGIGKFSLERVDNLLQMTDEGSQVTYTLRKQSQDYPESLKEVTDDTQTGKLQMFYEDLKENYAFAEIYRMNFDREYKRCAAMITDESTNEEVYQAMCSMVTKLDDGHVSITMGDKSYCPSDYMPEWMKDKNQAKQLIQVIKDNYLKDYYRFKNCYIRYGTLREDIGYVVIQAIGMEKFDKSASTIDAMNRIIREFKDKDTLVIDLRFSPGGYDETALAIAGYFTDNAYLAYQKQAYDKGDYTSVQNIYVKSRDEYFPGNVILLTSGYTISAAETLGRDILANPLGKVTVVGETTAGYYSDAIPKLLPGGIEYTFSMERYYWFDGTMLEGNGIEPNIEIPFDINAVKDGKDPAIDWVLSQN
jgi:C-terminal processing protease CtpA/Prc